MTTASDQRVCANCERPWDEHNACLQCGRTMYQPEDPGSYRDYCSNACRQRAYRARTNGARRQRERMFREAWEQEEARKERERQRSYRRRHGTPPPPPPGMPHYFREQPNDADAARRRRARGLWERASHHATPPHEASACRQRAEEMATKYGWV